MTPSRLTRAREMAGLSVGQAVNLLGWPRAQLLAVEASDTPPSGEVIRALADLYGTSVEWLRGEPVDLRESTRAVLRQVEHAGDRATLTELLEAVQGTAPPNQPSVGSPENPLRVRTWTLEELREMQRRTAELAAAVQEAIACAHHLEQATCRSGRLDLAVMAVLAVSSETPNPEGKR